jgi:hypothetical protein
MTCMLISTNTNVYIDNSWRDLIITITLLTNFPTIIIVKDANLSLGLNISTGHMKTIKDASFELYGC